MVESLTLEDRRTVQYILNHPGTFATVLHAIAYHFFGEEIYSWDPITLVLELNEEFELELPDANQDKLNAIIASITSDTFYSDWAAFTAVCECLCGDTSPLGISEPLLPEEAAWGYVEVKLNDDTPSPFSDELCRYVGQVLYEEGFVDPPSCLAFADMPEHYQGSDTGPEIHQQELADFERGRVLDTYLKEQCLVMLKQISALPWVTEQDLEQLSVHLRTAQRA